MHGNQVTIQDSAPILSNILVMEDEHNVAKGLEMILVEEGHAVDLAMTGRDALESFGQKKFDLLVADLRLPDISGLEVIKKVKQKWPETSVVVITGYASVASAVDAMRLGSFDYLPKPFTEDEIITTIDSALKGKKSVPSSEVIQKVERKEEQMLIQKEEVIEVLNRTIVDKTFWQALMEKGSDILQSYRLSPAAKAAIVSGDLEWIRNNVGSLTQEQLAFLYKRLEREYW